MDLVYEPHGAISKEQPYAKNMSLNWKDAKLEEHVIEHVLQTKNIVNNVEDKDMYITMHIEIWDKF